MALASSVMSRTDISDIWGQNDFLCREKIRVSQYISLKSTYPWDYLVQLSGPHELANRNLYFKLNTLNGSPVKFG